MDASDEDRQEKKKPGIGQHRKPPSPFKGNGKPVGKESDERVGAEYEVRAYGGALPKKVVDQQSNRQPEQHEVVGCRGRCEQQRDSSQYSYGRRSCAVGASPRKFDECRNCRE